MRFVRRLSETAFLIVLFTVTTYAQDQSISGPILGFTADSTATAVSPILGVLGASVLGDQLDFGIEIRNAVISPEQNYALAIRNDNGTLIVLRLLQGFLTFTELSESDTGASRIAISPKGTSAAFLNGASKSLRTFRGLPDFPEPVYEFDTSILPGEPKAIAVSDDGIIVLANFVDDSGQDTTWVITSNGSLWQVPSTHVSSMAFLPHRYDAILADPVAQEVFLLLDLDTAGNRVPLISLNGSAGSSIDVAVSQDRSLFIVVSEAQGVTIVDAGTYTSNVIDCSCVPKGLRSFGNGLFLLDGPPSDLLHVLDASSEPRVVVIPAKRNPAGPEPEGSGE